MEGGMVLDHVLQIWRFGKEQRRFAAKSDESGRAFSGVVEPLFFLISFM